MSTWEKLLDRIYCLSNDIRFQEITKVLKAYGYTKTNPSGGSSHYTFRKPGKPPITIPKHEPIKKVYIKIIKQMLESEENDENNH